MIGKNFNLFQFHNYSNFFSENFKKEDLAKTLLYTMCQELVRTAINAMHMTKTKHLFVAGSFISHPLTQRLVEEEFEYSRWGGAMYYDGIVSKNELKHFIVNTCNTLIIQFETMKSMLNENVLKGPQVLVHKKMMKMKFMKNLVQAKK